MKKLLYSALGIIVVLFMINMNHEMVEKDCSRYKTEVLMLLDLADIKAKKNDWTTEQMDSFYDARKREIAKPGFCVYCWIRHQIQEARTPDILHGTRYYLNEYGDTVRIVYADYSKVHSRGYSEGD